MLPCSRMDPRAVAERLRRAEAEYQAAQREHDGSDRATVRYQQARGALLELEAIVRAMHFAMRCLSDGQTS